MSYPRTRTSSFGNGLDGPVTIERVELFRGRVPTACRFSYGTETSAPFTLVKMSSADEVGWGEVRIAATPEMELAAPAMVGTDADSLDGWLAERFALETPQRMWAEAFSMAGHDLAARTAGRPLHTRFGPALRRNIPLMPCMFPEDADHAARQTLGFVSRGVRHLKTKLYGDPAVDLKHLRAIRKSASDSVVLLGDVNRAYRFEDLRDGLLPNLRAAGLDVLEDPCDGTPEQYAELRGLDGPKIMLDVDARSNARLERFLAAGACDIVNLHPCQQGTLSNAVARAALCASYGTPVSVGATGYIGVGTAAYHHLAGCIGTDHPCGELGGHLDHGMPVGLVSYEHTDPSSVTLSEGPGHGASPLLAELAPHLLELTDADVPAART